MKCNSCLFAVLTMLAVVGASAKVQSARPAQEQTHFNAGDPGVEHPAPIPGEVLAILGRDDHVKHALNYQGITPENLPASWFSASEIALGSSREKDLIVAAEGPLIGANVDTFWVFIHRGRDYSLVLTIPALGLTVKNSRTNGYRDLEAGAATAVTITTASFRFDGQQYKLFSAKTEKIR